MPKVFLQVSMDESGQVFMELPGSAGRTRSIPMTETALLFRVLKGLQAEERLIGRAGAPTERQALHWTKHSVFEDPRCPFCQAEKGLRGVSQAHLKAGLRQLVRKCDGVEVRVIPGKPALKSKKTAEDLGF